MPTVMPSYRFKYFIGVQIRGSIIDYYDVIIRISLLIDRVEGLEQVATEIVVGNAHSHEGKACVARRAGWPGFITAEDCVGIGHAPAQATELICFHVR